jgi:SAM-dependent methyltransferase
MNDDLYSIMMEGAFADRAEFDAYVGQSTPEEIYELVMEGAFANFEEFNELYFKDGQVDEKVEDVKKKDESQNPFASSEEVVLPSMPGGTVDSSESESSSDTPEELDLTKDNYEQPVNEDINLTDASVEDPFSESVNNVINPDLLTDTEESVIPKMKNYFSQYGFTFKTADYLGDGMNIEAENGNKLYVNLDRASDFFSISDSQEDSAKELQAFLRDNRRENEEILNQAGVVVENQRKAYNEKEILETVKNFNKQAQGFENRVKEYALYKNKLDKYYEVKLSNVTKEQLENDEVLRANYEQWNKLNERATEMLSDLRVEDENFQIQGQQLDRMAGEYLEMRQDMGSYSGGFYNALLDGSARISAGVMDALIDGTTYALPNAGMSEKEYKNEIARVALENGDFPSGNYRETIPKEDIDENGMVTLKDPELGTDKKVSVSLFPSVFDLSKDEMVEILGGDTNDWKFVGNAINIALATGVPGPGGARIPVSPVGDITPKSAYDKAHSKVLDLARKGLKYEEGYDQAKSKDMQGGRYRNSYSSTATNADTSLGMLEATRDGLREVAGVKQTTKEWSDLEKQSFWGGALLGVTESLPAMLGGSSPVGWAQRTAQMYSQVTDHVNEEMEKDAAFDMISEAEKQSVKIPIGVAVGTLEAIGLRNVLRQKGFLNGVIGRAMARSNSKTTAKTFSEMIRQDVSSMIARGGLVITGAGAAEYETGFLQEAAELTIKDIYNDSKEKEMFKTPDTWQDWIRRVNRAGLQEAVGGFVLGAPRAMATAVSGLEVQSLDDRVFKMFEQVSKDPNYMNMYVTKLKQRIADTKDATTKKEAQEELDLVRQLQGALEQIPKEYNTKQKKEAIQLIFQKNKLDNEIQSEDKILSKPKQELLNKVNDRLAAIVGEVVIEQQQGRVNEQKIQDFEDGTTEVQNTTQVTPEEQNDIDEFFNEENDNSDVRADNLSINRNNKGGKNKNPFRNDVIRIAELGAKAIAKVLPDVKIVMHEDNEQFLKYAKLGQGRAEYNPDNKTIHVNLSSAKKTTVPHEIFHAVLMDKIKSDPAIAKAAETMLMSVRKVMPKGSELSERIERFAKGYEGDIVQNEERLAELIGILSSEYRTLTKPQKNIVVDFLKTIARTLGIEKVLAKYGVDVSSSEFGKTDADIVDLLNAISTKTRKGEALNQSDIQALETISKEQEQQEQQEEEQGSEGEVGTLQFPRQQIEIIDSPKVQNDPRPWVKELVQDVDVYTLDGRNFVTNMYDYTNAGLTELGNGYSINLLGGRNYVPIIMNKTGRKLGDVSNLAAFNTKSQAEGFIRNATEGKADLFAPHSGTLNGSWQFQQHIFESLVDLVLDEKILSKKKLIDAFNSGLQSKEGKSALEKFNNKNNSRLKNLNSFKGDPKALVTLLDIENNYSPDLRKILNQKIASDKTFQKAIGVKNLNEFHSRMTDPLNKGVVGGEIMSFVEFDPTTFEVAKTNPKDVDHHPSFGWVVKAKIKKIMQPSKFFKSYDVTDTYTKYNTDETVVSRKAEPNFAKSNVTSSAGAIPKVATVNRKQSSRQQKIDKALSKASGTTQVATTTGSYVKAANILNNLEIKGEVLDFGAGLGLGTDAMSKTLGSKVDSYEINPERWKGNKPVTYTKVEDINKKYDAIVSLNVLNVVPKGIRDGIVQDIYTNLKPGGTAVISTRGFKGDINSAKNFELGPEEKSYIIKRKKDGGIVDVYQKGFDGNELVEYIQDILGDKVKVAKKGGFGSRGVIVQKLDGAKPKGRQQKSIEEIARYYQMNTQGFFPKGVDLYRVKKLLPPGYSVKQSKFDQYGRGGSYYLVNSRGYKINPYKNKGRQQKEIEDYILEARSNNFKEGQIKDFLIRTKKFPAKLVNQMMEIDADLFESLPKSFGNIEGGQQAGIKLYQKIEAYKQKLTKNNKRRKNKLTQQEIVDKTIEFLEQQPEYIAEGDTYTVGSKKKGTQVTKTRKGLSLQQAQMLSDLQSSIDIRPSQNMGVKLAKARLFLRQAKKGARDLQAVKTQVRNFIRKSLPKEIYDTKEVMALINEVTAADTSNIDNVMERVTEFVIKTNVKSLKRKISQILNGKYTEVVNNRKRPKKITSEILKRIEFIKSNLLSEKATPEDIAEANLVLLARFDELMGKLQQTVAEQEEMVDIQLAMQYNNALGMDNGNSQKVTELDGVANTLTELVKYGRSLLKEELLKMHQYYNKQFEEGYEAITETRVDMTDPDAKSELNNVKRNRKSDRRKKEATRGVLRTFFSTTKKGIFNFIASAEALDGLMMRLDKLPGEMFGGRLNEMFTERIDASSRMFKGRMLLNETVVQDFLLETYGKGWKKKSREHRVRVDHNIQITDGVMLPAMSQNQLAYLYNMYKNPANLDSFANPEMYGVEVINKEDSAKEKNRKKKENRANARRVMSEIESKIDDDVKTVADWQVEVLYPSLYSHYNKTYKKLYRTDLPWNNYYAGTIYREGIAETETDVMNIVGAGNVMRTAVGATATKTRINSTLPIRDMDMMDVLNTYINEMEYVAAYGETVRDMDKFFKNKYVKDAIIDIHGENIYGFVKDMIEKIATRGTQTGLKASVINGMNNVFILSRLALSPVIAIKQLTSTFTYMNDIGPINWLKYAAKNKTQQLKVWKEVTANSVYMQDRNNQSIMRAIETYTDTQMKEFIPRPAKDWALNFMMYTTKWGDRNAIMLGGLPNYSYYKAQAIKDGKSEQEAIDIAIRKFERDTKRTQQSSDLQDKDFLQTGDPITRALNMFLTTPKQYLRKEIIATRELYRMVSKMDTKAGKGTLTQNLRTFVTYHIFMPVLFQYVSMGLPGLLRGFRDDDDEDLIRAAVIGNLNALFLLGEVVTMAGDYLTDKPWAGSQSKSVGVLQIAGSITRKLAAASNTKDPQKRADNFMKVYLELATITGLPAPTIAKFFDNYSKLDEGDPGEMILRLLNYSKYTIEGSNKSKRSSTSKVNSSEKYLKDLEKADKEFLKEQKGESKKKSGFGTGGFGGGGFGTGGFGDGGFD